MRRDPAAVTAYVALGANLGAARRAVLLAMAAIDALPRTRVARQSSLYRSAPVDAGGPDFVNAVVAVETGLGADELLAHLQQIETAGGRERPYRNAPRTLDLDILLFGDESIATNDLIVPHPRMFERAFVLVPLSEIAPSLVSPARLDAVAGQRIEKLAATGDPS